MYHEGSIIGFSDIIYRDTKLKRFIVILANEYGYDTRQFLNDIVSMLDSYQ